MVEQTDQQTVKEEKKDLIEAAKKLPPPEEVFSLRPRNFEEAFRFANLIAESDLIPKEFHKKPANVLVAVQLGMELGVSPMQALQNMYVINGRPSIYGDLLPAIVFQSGYLESIHEEGDEKTASCTVKRKGHEPITRTFTWADAERAKLTERNPTYKSYPKRMLQLRARALAIRDMFPDVMKGVAVYEEIEEVEIVPPDRPQIKAPQPLKPDVNVSDPRVREREPEENRARDRERGGTDEHVHEPRTRSSKAHVEEPRATPTPEEEPLKDVALKLIAGFALRTFPEPDWLTPYMKALTTDEDRLAVTNAYNARKKELEEG